MVKNLPAKAGTKRHGLNPWVGKIPWRRAWRPTPVFLPGESHGHQSLVGYSPWGRREADTTEALTVPVFLLSGEGSDWHRDAGRQWLPGAPCEMPFAAGEPVALGQRVSPQGPSGP